MTKNRRAKLRTRKLAAEQGISYGEALRQERAARETTERVVTPEKRADELDYIDD